MKFGDTAIHSKPHKVTHHGSLLVKMIGIISMPRSGPHACLRSSVRYTLLAPGHLAVFIAVQR